MKYFGCITWAAPVFKKLLGDSQLASFSDVIDDFVNVKASAFKFVMCVRKTE